jgi:hypothetical protein
MDRAPTPRLAASGRETLTVESIGYFPIGEPLAAPWFTPQLPETIKDFDLVRPVPERLPALTPAFTSSLTFPCRPKF